ncbi:MAG: acetyl-CoA carboxylase biotin carboxylase subunit [Candidatus Aminicenantes bacterium]|nr:acetyl-CoA carboxylase biotin carboxylase subunit [Candidatus Aminicenantes bacterium]
MFEKILIANRGEIAVRIIRACQEMGISTVAVYSEADRKSLHVQFADEAVCIGPAQAVDSYLDIDNIIHAAKEKKAQAIHPGYGFLAENPSFSLRCEKEGIVFIGPNSRAMDLVGDKVRSRQTVEKAGVPIIPGMKCVLKNISEYEKEADKIGYPLMIKASAGGGGKGMRIVHSHERLKAGLEAGMREAKSAFGDESVYLEKCIQEPRHVEFQILADNYGNIVHLFERECSIQRRHQKIIEESPSQALDEGLRDQMGEVAKRVIQVTGYNNAGTVEFLLDKDRNFYFLEVNARLQVEHPVTELVTGLDIVQHQILIAAGKKLKIKQSSLHQKGHSIECRIYAEDPENNFLPSSGKILFINEPAGPGIRLDSGIYSGCEVPIYYDPILSKLVVWAENREMACQRMVQALEHYVILGVKTSISFLKEVISSPMFRRGDTTTDFIEKQFKDGFALRKDDKKREICLLAAAFLGQNRTYDSGIGKKEHGERSPWQTLGKWRLGRSEESGT